MSRRRFSILRVGDGWHILGQGRKGEFESSELAALATARLVAEAIHDGYQVDLVMERRPHMARPVGGDDPANADIANAHARYRETTGPFAVAVDEAGRCRSFAPLV